MNNYRSRPSRGNTHYKNSGPKSRPFKRRDYSGSGKYKGYRDGRRNPYGSSLSESMYISKPQKHEAISMHEKSITFSDFKLQTSLQENIKRRGYVHPTKVQAQVIAHILEGRDIIGLAGTGSGKTAAFLIPMINAVLENQGTRVLIVAPTRELVNQIQDELFKLARNLNIRDVIIIGGASYSTQIRLLKRNPHFVVATPGRLLDLCKGNHINLGAFNKVVLDEVDQMLDMGFIHDIRDIISQLKDKKQSLFFSATMTPKIKEIATSLLTTPVIVEVETQKAAANVDQDIVRVGRGANKINVLHELLINTEFHKVLVFSKTKRRADELAISLQKMGHRVDALHGDKPLGKRTKILTMFRRDEIDILVATDVASRGIDVSDISHVINYDQPATYEDYIHRIGRTGRIGKKGFALTFV